ncbi:MAG: type II secretion system protein [Armatimonadetes bacterium]|nr:type II secretion system protein [Armatimonadota bacterium]
MKKAFTLTECLVSLAIILTIAALLTPVVINSKRAGQVTVSIQHLRQIHLAVKQYQVDSGGDGNYGSLEEMGLPHGEYVARTLLNQPLKLWQSGCGVHPSDPHALVHLQYWPGNGGKHWMDNVVSWREQMILTFDLNCSDHDVNFENTMQAKYGIGVLLGGNAVKRRKSGSYADPAWWAKP